MYGVELYENEHNKDVDFYTKIIVCTYIFIVITLFYFTAG